MKSLEGQEPMASTLSCASMISWRMDVHGKASLAAPTSIVQAYNQASTGLLILGDPGVGKSTLLLELAFGLLTRAVQDTTQPVPVLVNLSSWALNKPPLTIWLEEQLHSMCGIQRHWMGWMKWNRLLEPPVLHLSMTIENKRSISFASSSVLAAMSMVILAYQGQTVEDLPHLGSAEDQQRQVFEHYVTRVLEQQTGTWRYTARATRQWLIWLAQQMQQRSWLPTERAQGLYSWLFGLVVGLVYGGASFLNHYLIRLVLWQRGVMPWHYVRFLEESTERKLLQSFGGGYRFIHPLIQEYFASLGKRTSDSTQSHSSSP